MASKVFRQNKPVLKRPNSRSCCLHPVSCNGLDQRGAVDCTRGNPEAPLFYRTRSNHQRPKPALCGRYLGTYKPMDACDHQLQYSCGKIDLDKKCRQADIFRPVCNVRFTPASGHRMAYPRNLWARRLWDLTLKLSRHRFKHGERLQHRQASNLCSPDIAVAHFLVR